MNFETKVMQIVKEVVGENSMDGFCFGTLFVNCMPSEAKKLKKRLNKEFDNKVQMAAQGGHMEYSYDFVA